MGIWLTCNIVGGHVVDWMVGSPLMYLQRWPVPSKCAGSPCGVLVMTRDRYFHHNKNDDVLCLPPNLLSCCLLIVPPVIWSHIYPDYHSLIASIFACVSNEFKHCLLCLLLVLGVRKKWTIQFCEEMQASVKLGQQVTGVDDVETASVTSETNR